MIYIKNVILLVSIAFLVLYIFTRQEIEYKKVINVGAVIQGSPAIIPIKITNKSLFHCYSICNIRSSCGCTIISNQNIFLFPLQSKILIAKLFSRGKLESFDVTICGEGASGNLFLSSLRGYVLPSTGIYFPNKTIYFSDGEKNKEFYFSMYSKSQDILKFIPESSVIKINKIKIVDSPDYPNLKNAVYSISSSSLTNNSFVNVLNGGFQIDKLRIVTQPF